MNSAVRVHYMDHLRALAMLAGVVFHAALAYSPMLHGLWPTADAGGSAAIDVVAWALHLFRMPLFFVVAGFFTALLVERRGLAGLFRTRALRVLLPLIVLLPPVLLSLHALTVAAVTHLRHPSPLLVLLADYARTHDGLPLMPTLAHLWFLAYLMLFTLLVWAISTLEPSPRLVAALRAWRPSWPVAAIAPIVLVPALAATSAPWPAPESPLPQLWAIAFFGAYFALGYALRLNPALLDRLRRPAPLLVVAALALYAALPWVLGTPRMIPPEPAMRWLDAALQAFAGFWLTLGCLIAGRAWLDTANPAMRWLADAAYWVYLVHLPLLFALQYPLLDVALPWGVKFVLSTGLTLALSLASYQWLVRHTWIGRWLNGTRPGQAAGRTRSAALPGN